MSADSSPDPPRDLPDDLDDRVALLFVACDEALAPGARMVLALRVVCGLSIAQTAMHLGIQESAAAARLTRAKRTLAQARGEFRVPDPTERSRRLPVVLDCVAGMFTVAHRSGLEPPDALSDTGRQALSIADALVAMFPDDTEVHGLRAVVRLGLARRPGRVVGGVAMTLDEVESMGRKYGAEVERLRTQVEECRGRFDLADPAFGRRHVRDVGLFAERFCECKDAACIAAMQQEKQAWDAEQADELKTWKPTDEQRAEVAQKEAAIKTCSERVVSPPPPAGP
jgi:hypothetical protein